MVTVASLCRALPGALLPVTPAEAPQADVTGVHVSELVDPTPFLDGGELLLTTGLSLSSGDVDVGAYVSRLTSHGVSGLGFGVGPVRPDVDPELRRACRDRGLPLLVVPEDVPFQVVIREFWGQTGVGHADAVRVAVGGVHGLVRASLRREPEEGIVRALADALDGWVAVVDAAGEVRQCHPDRAQGAAREVAAQLRRLRLDAPHSAASFAHEGDDVLVHTLHRSGASARHLVAGCAAPVPAHARHVVLSACALLQLRHEISGPQSAVRAAAPIVLGTLVRLDHPRAAADLAAAWGHALPTAVRVVAVDGVSDEDLARLAEEGDALFAPGDPAVLVVPAARAPSLLSSVRSLVRSGVAGATDSSGGAGVARAAVSASVPWGEIARAAARVEEAVTRTEPGEVRDLTPRSLSSPDETLPGLAALERYARADLVGTLASYLRHRGRIEPVAEELGLHRNSVRHRLDIVRGLVDVDLDDPDVAARWWLGLRARGLA